MYVDGMEDVFGCIFKLRRGDLCSMKNCGVGVLMKVDV